MSDLPTHGRDCPCTPCRAEDWDEIDRKLQPLIVTPVEERIDHEDVLRKLRDLRQWDERAQCFDAETQRRTDQRVRDFREIERAYLDLLTEHSAREEALQEIKAEAFRGRGDPRVKRFRWIEEYAAEALALPAKEPAQPEEEPNG